VFQELAPLPSSDGNSSCPGIDISTFYLTQKKGYFHLMMEALTPKTVFSFLNVEQWTNSRKTVNTECNPPSLEPFKAEVLNLVPF
jgi:hypothetical protein